MSNDGVSQSKDIDDSFGASSQGNQIESPAINVDDLPNIDEKKASPLVMALRRMFQITENERCKPGQYELRLRPDYRSLFSCLTPRQIKSYLRDRLLAPTTRDEMQPWESLLRTLFHAVWKLRRDERDIFNALASAAKATLAIQSRSEREKLSVPHVKLFELQFFALAKVSSVMDEDSVRSCWPKKSEERALLLNLLAMALNESDGDVKSSPKNSQMSFFSWVRQRFDKSPRSGSLAEQVSSFQDIALASYRAGNSMAQLAVAEYADRFLEQHKKYFDAGMAISLSNLAVIINDLPGYEAQCDRLFSAALGLLGDIKGSRIPFFYVEFLLDTLADEQRRGRLVNNVYKGDDKSLLEHAQDWLEKSKNDSLAPNELLYLNALQARLNAREQNWDPEKSMSEAWGLAVNNAKVLLDGGREPSTRFSDFLDSVVGKGDTALKLKEPLLVMIWAAIVESGGSGWSMAVQVANDMVGESRANSLEENAGLCLNASLLQDERMLREAEPTQLSAIWSQSAALFSRRLGRAGKSRVALAFLAAAAYGGNRQNITRMESASDRLGEDHPGTSLKAWRDLIEPESLVLLEALESDPLDPKKVAPVVKVVFGDDLGPFKMPSELVSKMGWDNLVFEWADKRDIGQAVSVLLETAKALGGENHV